MTSKALRLKFEQIYEAFVEGASTVTSCPANCWIVGEHATLRGSLGAKQNLPLRAYCAISPSARDGITVAREMQVYLPSKARFEPLILPDGICRELERTIGSTCARFLGRPILAADVRFLSEAPILSGLGVSGAMASALSLALALQSGAISVNAAADICSQAPDLDRAAGPQFDQIFRLAWYLDSVAQEGISSGAASLCALMRSPVPIVFGLGGAVPREESEFLSASYIAFPLSSTLSSSSADRWTWPLTFALIYSGMRRPTGASVRASAWLGERAGGIFKFWHRVFDGVPSGERFGAVLSTSGENILRRYVDALAVLSADTVKLMSNLFEHGAQPKDFSRFVRNIDLYQHALSYMELSTEVIDRLVALGAIERTQGGVPVALKVTGAGGGGDVIAFAPRGQASAIERLVDTINGEVRPEVVLDFCEERDGVDTDGPKVEMADGDGRRDVRDYLLTVWENGTSRRTTCSRDELVLELRHWPLVLDKVEQSILVKGEKLHSADRIRSTKATLLVLPRLLERTGQLVAGSELSTWSSDTEHLQTRGGLKANVLQPLTEVLEERAGLKLNFELTGKLKDFHVRLLQPVFAIAIIELTP